VFNLCLQDFPTRDPEFFISQEGKSALGGRMIYSMMLHRIINVLGSRTRQRLC
jgi:hypothetical protein